MRWLAATALTALLLSSTAHGDSIFAVRGAGRDVVPVAGGSRAMGGAVAASSDPLACSVMSPFASALAERVTVTAGFAHTNTRTENAGEKERTLDTLFPAVSAIIPYRMISVMAGLYLEKEGRITLALADSAYGEGYDLEYRRETSIHTVPLFVSSRLHRRLLVSAGVLFSAFDTRETHTMDFDTDDRADAEDAIDVSASGHAFAAGIMVDLDILSFAALYRSKADLDGSLDSESRYAGVWDSRNVELKSEESYKIGMRLRPHRYLALELDYETSPWSKMEIDGERIAETDVYRWSAGIEYRGPLLWDAEKYPVLAGYYKQPLDWEDPLTGEITEEVFSLGASIPLAQARAALSFALEFGRREPEKGSDLRETFYGLSLSVSAIEAWRREVRTRP